MKTPSALTALLLASACSQIPSGAYFDRGQPESLLDVSSEVVNMNVDSTAAYAELSNMIAQDKPARAEVNCDKKQQPCADAHALFATHNVPVVETSGPKGITLIYERIVARDCEQRYIDNSINPYNLHHPTFGCSVAANAVQMVSDKTQYTNPSLSDYQDGEIAVRNYRVYLSLPAQSDEDDGESLLQSITTN